MHLVMRIRRDIIGLETNYPTSTAVSTGLIVLHTEDVDIFLDAAKSAGAEIIKTAQDIFYGGYAGYLRDPNAH